MPMLSGQNGKVLVDGVGVANITRWKFATRTEGPSYASSATDGFRKRLAGVRHGSGIVRFLQDTVSPIQSQLTEGDSVTLRLHIDTDAFYSVPAVIEKIAIDTDIDSIDPVGGEFTFDTTGAWIPPTFSS